MDPTDKNNEWGRSKTRAESERPITTQSGRTRTNTGKLVGKEAETEVEE